MYIINPYSTKIIELKSLMITHFSVHRSTQKPFPYTSSKKVDDNGDSILHQNKAIDRIATPFREEKALPGSSFNDNPNNNKRNEISNNARNNNNFSNNNDRNRNSNDNDNNNSNNNNSNNKNKNDNNDNDNNNSNNSNWIKKDTGNLTGPLVSNNFNERERSRGEGKESPNVSKNINLNNYATDSINCDLNGNIRSINSSAHDSRNYNITSNMINDSHNIDLQEIAQSKDDEFSDRIENMIDVKHYLNEAKGAASVEGGPGRMVPGFDEGLGQGSGRGVVAASDRRGDAQFQVSHNEMSVRGTNGHQEMQERQPLPPQQEYKEVYRKMNQHDQQLLLQQKDQRRQQQQEYQQQATMTITRTASTKPPLSVTTTAEHKRQSQQQYQQSEQYRQQQHQQQDAMNITRTVSTSTKTPIPINIAITAEHKSTLRLPSVHTIPNTNQITQTEINDINPVFSKRRNSVRAYQQPLQKRESNSFLVVSPPTPAPVPTATLPPHKAPQQLTHDDPSLINRNRSHVNVYSPVYHSRGSRQDVDSDFNNTNYHENSRNSSFSGETASAGQQQRLGPGSRLVIPQYKPKITQPKQQEQLNMPQPQLQQPYTQSQKQQQLQERTELQPTVSPYNFLDLINPFNLLIPAASANSSISNRPLSSGVLSQSPKVGLIHSLPRRSDTKLHQLEYEI